MSGWTARRAAPFAGLFAAALVLCGEAAATETAATPKALTEGAAAVTQPAAVPGTRIESNASPDAVPAKPAKKKLVKKKPRKPVGTAKAGADDTPKLPPGPLHVIVSLDKQTATLFAGGIPVASSPISSGTRTHPTPMGVFSVLQKNRHHISNLYGAPMPYMQRLTWSGTALHQGPLPGYPASHGCVRMTKEFSELLWRVTRIGARVIIARSETAPVEIAHPALFVPRPAAPDEVPSASRPPAAGRLPSATLSPAARDAEARVVRTADASNRLPRTVVEDTARPMVAAPLANASAPEQPTKLPIESDGAAATAPVTAAEPAPSAPSQAPQPATVAAATTPPQDSSPPAPSVTTAAEPSPADPSPAEPAIDPRAIAAEAAARAREARRRAAPISVFVSRREGKLYVRQGMEPLFDAPIAIANPERPIGTHVYTAMEAKDDGLRWTVVSIPSSYPRAEETAKPQDRKQRNSKRPLKAEPVDLGPPSNASEALGRIAIPPEAVARIAQIVKPGSSLIVSDNRLSNETGKTTDFIVETP